MRIWSIRRLIKHETPFLNNAEVRSWEQNLRNPNHDLNKSAVAADRAHCDLYPHIIHDIIEGAPQ
jgi:hypothetical protein